MKASEIVKKIEELQKELEDRKYQRKRLASEYEELVKIVKTSGMIFALAIAIFIGFVGPFSYSKKHIVLGGLARWTNPWAMLVCLISGVLFIWRGFDLLVNSDTNLGNKLAQLVGINNRPAAAVLADLNNDIMKVEVAIQKLEDALYESGDYSNKSEKTYNEVPIKNEKAVAKDKKIDVEDKIKINEDKEIDKLDEILNFLKELGLDDEDDFESTSEMWEKDTKHHRSHEDN